MPAAPPSSSRSRTHARCFVSLTTVICWRPAVSPAKAIAPRFWPTTVFNVPISEFPIHENYRRAFALGYPARLPAANPGRARAAEGDREFAGQIQIRSRDGAIFPRQQRADHSRLRLFKIPADGR